MVTKMQQREKRWRRTRRKRRTSGVNGVMHRTRRAKRRLRCHLQLWIWRKSNATCHLGFMKMNRWFIGSLPRSCLGLIAHRRKRSPCSAILQEARTKTETSFAAKTPLKQEDPCKLSACAKLDTKTHANSAKKPGTVKPTHELNDLSRHDAVSQDKAPTYLRLKNCIHEFLKDFHRRYGSFIPFQRNDVLNFLQLKFNDQINIRWNLLAAMVSSCLHEGSWNPSFRVVFKKHVLTLADLYTLAQENWLNDQVMNMYGELIMVSSKQKVHFLNSFFYQQLMTKGYEGVRRWTKQVDLFSHKILLVPVHMEVHWCVVAIDVVQKKICLYDSQGLVPQTVSMDILRYLMTEAKEKQHKAFEKGWLLLPNKGAPLQMNENDCGVFVLEYCRCLAFGKPLQFSQSEIPLIRKRIYKELCDSKIQD